MEEFGKLEERVVLVGVQTDDHDNVEESLDELEELADTAGASTQHSGNGDCSSEPFQARF